MKYEITKEQLRSLRDPKVKDMFPEAFKEIIEEGKWYKTDYGPIAFCEKLLDGGTCFTGYCVWPDGSFEGVLDFGLHKDWQPATQEEVFESLKSAAIKMGYKKGLYCIFGKAKNVRAIKSDEFTIGTYDSNVLALGYDCIFKDGKWAKIVNKNLL
jgi:hypothetical protein